jgi:hypothetical protein
MGAPDPLRGPPDDPQARGATDDHVSFGDRVQLIARLQELSLDRLASLEKTLSDVAAVEAGATDEGLIGEAVRKVTPVKRLPPAEAAALQDRLRRGTAPARDARREAEQQLLELVTSMDTTPPRPSGPDSAEGS